MTIKMRGKGQTSIEYIFLIGGVLMAVALVAYFMQDAIFKPQTQKIENQTKEVKDMMKQLRDETPVNPGWVYPASAGTNH
ncbi:class III signal peptide-containing protein [Candidatus Micrarchaeota archaeon]|nr:class III signal peptide-containing protein [Candidatus Micrarchaeota archaeon]